MFKVGIPPMSLVITRTIIPNISMLGGRRPSSTSPHKDIITRHRIKVRRAMTHGTAVALPRVTNNRNIPHHGKRRTIHISHRTLKDGVCLAPQTGTMHASNKAVTNIRVGPFKILERNSTSRTSVQQALEEGRLTITSIHPSGSKGVLVLKEGLSMMPITTSIISNMNTRLRDTRTLGCRTSHHEPFSENLALTVVRPEVAPLETWGHRNMRALARKISKLSSVLRVMGEWTRCLRISTMASP
jgi:hypothetical protein